MNFKQLSTYIGRAIVALSFGFLFYVIYSLDFSKVIPLFELSWIPKILFLSLVFAFIYLFNAYAWSDILKVVSGKDLKEVSLKVYLQTVVYKYLPGNVFQFLGRHSLVKSHSLKHKELLLSNTIEIIMLLLSVLLMILVGSLFFDLSIDLGGYHINRGISISFSVAVIFAVVGVIYLKGYQKSIFKRSNLPIFLKVLIKNSLFLIGSALILYLSFYFFLNVNFDLTTFFKIIFVALIAWLIGFIIPGAPGGIGVRESIFVMLLPSILLISKEMVLVGALIYRLISITAEALTYLISKFFK